jgi:hypothetical protein
VRTAVLFPGALGDAVCLEPAVARLAGDGPVTLYARGGAAEIAALFPSEPRVASLDGPEIARLFAPVASPAPAIALGDRADPGLAFLSRFDRVRSFTGYASEELGSRLARHPDARVVPFPSREGGIHATHAFLRGALGDARVFAPAPRVRLAPARQVATHRPLLVLHPGSGGARKRAPAAVFLAVARAWRDRGGDVEIVLGPVEREEEDAWRQSGAVVLRPGDARALAETLVRASRYVGHDSGPSHVAAALGVRSAVVFVASDPRSFGPRGRAVTWLDVRAAPHDVARVGELVWRCVEPSVAPP